MISDVLFEAVSDIEDYERDLPHVYGDPLTKAKIARVKEAMRELQAELDSPCPCVVRGAS